LGKRKGRVSAGFCGTAVNLGRITPLFSPIQPLFGLFGQTFGRSAGASATANARMFGGTFACRFVRTRRRSSAARAGKRST
jgi:hypothetical protein